MDPTTTVELRFNPARDDLGEGKELRDGLSAALQIGTSLWVANDESISLERLSLIEGSDNGKCCYGEHRQFSLADYLRLPAKSAADAAAVEEIDVEGLDYADGYLWVVGSHSLKRAKPTLKEGAKAARKQLAKVSGDGNRYLLARIPVVAADGGYGPVKEDPLPGKARVAAQLHGDAKGNELTAALADDPHLGMFLPIPGKDNGFDIEGLAVAGKRLFIGLRGPVLRGWAVILEVEPDADKDQPSILRLAPIGPKQRLYRKHFLQLGGLGIRDICVQGADLLILGGPSMALDGPVSVFRWAGGAAPEDECVLGAKDLPRVLDLPYGQGEDHAEGMTLFAPDGGPARSLLVVYDSAAERRQSGESSLVVDVFLLP